MQRTDAVRVSAFDFDATGGAWESSDEVDLERVLGCLLGNVRFETTLRAGLDKLRFGLQAGTDTAIGGGSHDVQSCVWQLKGAPEPDTRSLVLMVFHDSEVALLADGRRITVPPGHLVIVVPEEPLTVIQSGACTWRTMRVSRAAIRLPDWTIEQVLHRPQPIGEYFWSLLDRALPGTSEGAPEGADISASGFDRYLAGLAELIVLSIFEAEQAHSETDRRRKTIEQFILRNLDDPRLSVEGIAAAHAMSRRTLYALFGDVEIGVAAFIRIARIELARRMLSDPAYDREPIQRIARHCGMLDAPHFSRVFRGTTGQSPLEFRRQRIAARFDHGECRLEWCGCRGTGGSTTTRTA